MTTSAGFRLASSGGISFGANLGFGSLPLSGRLYTTTLCMPLFLGLMRMALLAGLPPGQGHAPAGILKAGACGIALAAGKTTVPLISTHCPAAGCPAAGFGSSACVNAANSEQHRRHGNRRMIGT